MMPSVLLAVGMVCGGMTAYVAAMMAVLRRRKVCPSCGKKRVTGTQHLRATVVVDGVRMPEGRSFYRCEACGAEFGQRDDGPLIPKARWDEGMRDHPPMARALPPGSSGRMPKH
jgi:hypothetical protein